MFYIAIYLYFNHYSITRKSTNVSISAMLIDDGGLFLAALVDRGGCGIRRATGVFFWIFSGKQQQWVITNDLCKPPNLRRANPTEHSIL